MQRRHEKKQQLLLQLKEVVKLCWAEHAAQKTRREVEEKAKEKAERQRVIEEKKKKKRVLEYIQQLWDKVLEKEAVLLEGAEEFQVAGFKCKEIAARDKKGQRPSKKAKGRQLEKYYRGATVKMGGANPCERCVSTR